MNNSLWITISVIVPTILALVNIFQWFDKRSKNKALQSFLEAIHDMAKRLEYLDKGAEVKQKSQDICSVVNAAIVTVSGRPKKKKNSGKFLGLF